MLIVNCSLYNIFSQIVTYRKNYSRSVTIDTLAQSGIGGSRGCCILCNSHFYIILFSYI